MTDWFARSLGEQSMRCRAAVEVEGAWLLSTTFWVGTF
jgi:hypothetical protein